VTALRRFLRRVSAIWCGMAAPAGISGAVGDAPRTILAQVAHEPRTRHAAVSWPEAEVRRYRDELVALRPRRETDSAMRLSWDLSQPLEIPGVGRLHAVAARGDGLSQERIGHAPLMVGWRQGGETCQLPGRAHHHKLKKLLQEASIPPWSVSACRSFMPWRAAAIATAGFANVCGARR